MVEYMTQLTLLGQILRIVQMVKLPAATTGLIMIRSKATAEFFLGIMLHFAATCRKS